MVVSVEGNVSSCNASHPQKTLCPRVVMPSGTRNAFSFLQTSKAFRPMVVIVWGFMSTVSNCSQCRKAYSSITVTFAGMVMEVSPQQLAKAYVPMEVSVEGSTTPSSTSSS